MQRSFVVLSTAALILGGAAFVFTGKEKVFPSPNHVFDEPLRTIAIGNTTLRVAIADSVQERTIGLSGTKELPQGTGLLFVFDAENIPGFWMKDMLFPIDIIWIAHDGTVVGIDENISPDSFPNVFRPTTRVQYVLEVPAYFALEHTVQKDSKISVEMALQ